SPPAYPLAPATATFIVLMRMIIHINACSCCIGMEPASQRVGPRSLAPVGAPGYGRSMSRLEPSTYLQPIRDESNRLRDVLAGRRPALAPRRGAALLDLDGDQPTPGPRRLLRARAAGRPRGAAGVLRRALRRPGGRPRRGPGHRRGLDLVAGPHHRLHLPPT